MGASTPHFALQIRNRIARLDRRPPRRPPGPHRGRAGDLAAHGARPFRRGPRHPPRARHPGAPVQPRGHRAGGREPGSVGAALTVRPGPYGPGMAVADGSSRHPRLRAARALRRRRVRRGAARPPAGLRPRPADRRGVRREAHAGARLLRAARRARRRPVRDVARGLRPPRARARRARPGRAGRRRRRLRLLPRQHAPARRTSPSRSPACASPARGTCSPASSACGGASSPRVCASRRRRSRVRPSRARSGSSAASGARRATTCSPDCSAGAGPAGSSGRSPRCRTAMPRPRSAAR